MSQSSESADASSAQALALISDEDVDRMIGQSMNRLSVKEREQVIHDIHGVSEMTPEPPEMVAASRLQLRSELLKRMVEDNASSYRKALEMNPKYVTNQKFELMFLRASYFDVHEAAERLLLHFRYKEMLFGEASLVKDITRDDLLPGDVDVNRNEFMAMLPIRDQSGRPVFVSMSESCQKICWKNLVRPSWYATMKVVENEEIQLRGIVSLSLSKGSRFNANNETLENASFIQMALPYRIVAQHICTEDPGLHSLFRKMSFYMKESIRLRCRFHLGTEKDIQSDLRSFGISIPFFDLPSSPESMLIQRSIWWQVMRLYASIMRRKNQLVVSTSAINPDRKDATEVSEIVPVPLPADVISGRGGNARRHAGNARMFELTREYAKNYSHANKSGKTNIVRHIVETIHDEGGRFLKRTDDGWVLMSEVEMREKVGKAFRRCKM